MLLLFFFIVETREKINLQLGGKRKPSINKKYVSTTTESDDEFTEDADDVQDFKNVYTFLFLGLVFSNLVNILYNVKYAYIYLQKLQNNAAKKKRALMERNQTVLNKLETLFEPPVFQDSNDQESEDDENHEQSQRHYVQAGQSDHRLAEMRVHLESIDCNKYYTQSRSHLTKNTAFQQNKVNEYNMIIIIKN